MLNIFLVFILSLFYTISANAVLQISPLRVVLSSKHRTQDVMLINGDKNEVTFRVADFYYKYMDENGLIKENDPKYNPGTRRMIEKIVYYSPKQVTLKPGESQIVKFYTRFTDESIPDGEYNAHISFKQIQTNMNLSQPSEKDKKQFSINLVPLLSMQIPIVVVKGEFSYESHIRDVKLDTKNRKITFDVTSENSYTPFGDIVISTIDKNGKIQKELIKAKGIYVLSPLAKRHLELAYGSEALKKGDRVRISYFKLDSTDLITQEDVQF